MRALCEHGIHFGGQVMVVALGIAEGGEKHILGVWQGVTENTTVVKGLLADLVERGLDRKRPYLVVLYGSEVVRAGVQRVFGGQVEIQLPDSQAAECEGELIANFQAGHEYVNRARVSLPRNDIE